MKALEVRPGSQIRCCDGNHWWCRGQTVTVEKVIRPEGSKFLAFSYRGPKNELCISAPYRPADEVPA